MRTCVEPGLVERLADGTHPSVHHVGGCYDVAAGFGLHHRLPPQDLDGLVVGDIAVANHPIVPVGGERVERHVTQHAEIRHGLLQRRYGPADEISGIQRLAAFSVLQMGRHRREYGDGRNAQLGSLAGGIDECCNRQPKDVRHRRDRLLTTFIVDKDGPDQVARGQYAFGDEFARPRIAAVAPQTRLRVGGERRQECGHGITPGDRAARAANVRQNRLTCGPRQREGAGPARPIVAARFFGLVAALSCRSLKKDEQETGHLRHGGRR